MNEPSKAEFSEVFSEEYLAQLQARVDSGREGGVDIAETMWMVWCHATASANAHRPSAELVAETITKNRKRFYGGNDGAQEAKDTAEAILKLFAR